jgi:hypothetical protein
MTHYFYVYMVIRYFMPLCLHCNYYYYHMILFLPVLRVRVARIRCQEADVAAVLFHAEGDRVGGRVRSVFWRFSSHFVYIRRQQTGCRR